jgi:hypothetical protein
LFAPIKSNFVRSLSDFGLCHDSMAQVFALEDLRFSSGAWLLI